MSAYTGRLAALKQRFAGTPVAVTEPVFGYALQAAGLSVLTPSSFQLAVMEGNDPAPQDVQIEENLLKQKKVRLFAYNQQAVALVTVRLLPLARAAHIPVVGVYETKPLSMSYQRWMVAEMDAVNLALSKGISTERLH
jgi:zinc/manganese transport system substrate-binding protein